MREIKFRLFNKYDNQMYIFEPQWGNFGAGGGWVGGVLIEDYEKNGRTFAPPNQMQLEPERCEWMQFTGLLDKNGKEIYERDILQRCDGSLRIIKWSGRSMEMYSPTLPDRYWNTDATDFEMSEVIGNIYENPTLTESGKK